MKLKNPELALFVLIALIGSIAACGSNDDSPKTANEPGAALGERIASLDTGSSPPFEIADLRILYAGHPGSEREKDFVDFLKPHFKEVKTTALNGFTKKRADDCDVLILDYDGDGRNAPRPVLADQFASFGLQRSPSFTRATITVGVAGAFICSEMGLKTGYL